MEYKVLRPHQGDKWYAQGARRSANESDVAHLVKAGVLEPAASEQVGVDAPETKVVVPEGAQVTPVPEGAQTQPALEVASGSVPAVKDQK